MLFAGRGGGLVLLSVYVATRALLLWAGTHPDTYAAGGAPFVADADLFGRYASKVVHDDVAPYSGFALEYPPGSLPFIVAPELGRPSQVPFRSAFIALMLLVDGAGLAGVLTLSTRWGSALGPWLWTVLVPLVGPLAYVRLDLVPAVATVWALERASARAWFGTGAALGFGVLVKVYPVLLLPVAAAAVAARRRRALFTGAAVVVLVPLLPLLGSLPEMTRQVLEFHGGRDLHIESTFGSVLLFAKKAGHDLPFVSAASTLEFEGALPRALGFVSKAAVLASVAAGAWLTHGARPWPRRAPAAMFATLALAVGVGNVFSPQYLLWLVGLGSAAACAAGSKVRRPVILLLPAAGLTQALYPFYYEDILELETPVLGMLLARNTLVLACGVWVFSALRHRHARPLSGEGQAALPPP